MKKFFPGPLPDHGRNILRRLGYGEDRKWNGQISYMKRISDTKFPHYHVYLEDMNGGLQINLHVDQKEATHEGSSAHAGEYEGTLVETEMNYIARAIEFLKQESQADQPKPKPEKKEESSKGGFWG